MVDVQVIYFLFIPITITIKKEDMISFLVETMSSMNDLGITQVQPT